MKDFVRRWSRAALDRKMEDRRHRASSEAPGDGSALRETDPDPSQPETGPASPLPDVESLGPGSDFRPFLQRNVAPSLRRIALRKLWTSDPVFARLDGLNDYDEDFLALHREGTAMIRSALETGRTVLANPGSRPPEDTAPDLAANTEDGLPANETIQGESAEATPPERGSEAPRGKHEGHRKT